MENKLASAENISLEARKTERTNWADPNVCSLYDAGHDCIFDIEIGISPMINDLEQTHGTNVTILDYGCGSGRVSRLLTQKNFTKVEAVDTSEIMINMAKNHPLTESINYQKITSAKLPYADGYFDAAICSFVLLNIDQRDELWRVVGEIYRTLKPGGTFYILDLNPDQSAYRLTRYQIGETIEVQQEGEVRICYFEVPGKGLLKLSSTYWARSTYIDTLERSGFINTEIRECKRSHLSDEEIQQLANDKNSWAPYLLFKATKKLAA